MKRNRERLPETPINTLGDFQRLVLADPVTNKELHTQLAALQLKNHCPKHKATMVCFGCYAEIAQRLTEAEAKVEKLEKALFKRIEATHA